MPLRRANTWQVIQSLQSISLSLMSNVKTKGECESVKRQNKAKKKRKEKT